MRHTPSKARRPGIRHPPAATYEGGQGRQEDPQHVAPEHEAQHQQPRPAVRLGLAHPGSHAPAPLLQRHGDHAAAPACACALQPRSATAAPGSPICQLRLRRRSAATAAPWESSSRRLARLLTSPLWGSAGWYLGLLFPFCLPGYRSHVVPKQVLANRDWVVQCL